MLHDKCNPKRVMMSESLHTRLSNNIRYFSERKEAARKAKSLKDVRWIAQDQAGDWFAYRSKPYPSDDYWELENKDEVVDFLFKGEPNTNWSKVIIKTISLNRFFSKPWLIAFALSYSTVNNLLTTHQTQG